MICAAMFGGEERVSTVGGHPILALPTSACISQMGAMYIHSLASWPRHLKTRLAKGWPA